MACQEEKNPGLGAIRRPTHDWPHEKAWRRLVRRSTEGGNVFNGRDQRSMEKNHFAISKYVPKSSPRSWRNVLNHDKF